MELFNMPKIRPVPIKTRDENILKRAWAWLVSVRKWEFLEDWRLILPNGVVAVIPAGFIFDGASIPRLFWSLLSPTGVLFIPSVIHDFAYRYDFLWIEVHPGFVTRYCEGAGRAYWDRLFLEISEDINGLFGIDRVAYGALRIGGWAAWNRLRKAEAESFLLPLVPELIIMNDE